MAWQRLLLAVLAAPLLARAEEKDLPPNYDFDPKLPQKHELKHGIIFDAGSSGSRIHVYTWRSGEEFGGFGLLEDDLVKRKPGLSSFAESPAAAGSSLDPLLEHAKKKIPPELHASTPVFLMATAGLRLVGDEKAEAILESVRDTLSASPFLFKRDWAHVMAAKDEGIFGWVAVNYLAGTIGAKESQGIIDLGGGSVQFVYAAAPEHAMPDDHKGNFHFAGEDHTLYVRSHLGFGLDEFRKRTAQRLLDAGKEGEPVPHPCVPKGHQVSLPVMSGKHDFMGGGSYEGCSALLKAAFHCGEPPCPFDTASRPPVPPTIFGFSYMYDRTRAIGLLGGSVHIHGTQEMTGQEIRQAAKDLCGQAPAEVEQRFKEAEDAAKWANFCGDAVYIAELLEHGLGIEEDEHMTMGNIIEDVEVVWTLGAMIVKAASLQGTRHHEL